MTLTVTALPTFDTAPRTVSTDISAEQPSGLRAGQSLTLQDGGVLGENFAAIDATLNIEGGVVGNGLETAGSTVNISGGTVGAFGGSFAAFDGSVVDISGGNVTSSIDANSGSVVNFSGGNAGGFNAFSGSEVNISGGSLGGFNAFSGSDVELIGGEFAVNGAAFMGPLITLGDGDVFTGTLQDGSAFVFSPLRLDSLSGVTLTAAALPALNNTPQVVSTDISAGTSGLRAGQSLTLQDGGVLGGNFSAIGATLNIEGGAVSYTHLTLPTKA